MERMKLKQKSFEFERKTTSSGKRIPSREMLESPLNDYGSIYVIAELKKEKNLLSKLSK